MRDIIDVKSHGSSKSSLSSRSGCSKSRCSIGSDSSCDVVTASPVMVIPRAAFGRSHAEVDRIKRPPEEGRIRADQDDTSPEFKSYVANQGARGLWWILTIADMY